MIELEKEKYSMLTKPLGSIKINTLFARSVVEKKVSGKIFVDNCLEPTTFYVIHPYGMTLLFGNSDNEKFNKQFVDYALNVSGERNNYEWMQASPEIWDARLRELFKDKLVTSENNSNDGNTNVIELNTRVNFKFNLDKYLSFKKEHIKERLEIVRAEENSFNEMEGSVIPSNFWDNVNDFCENGVGFSIYRNGKLAATAYSAFIFDRELELGIETIPRFRGKGLAKYVCSVLIDYCVENNYEPIWSCKYENMPSYNLAKKLGFEPTISLPFYRLII